MIANAWIISEDASLVVPMVIDRFMLMRSVQQVIMFSFAISIFYYLYVFLHICMCKYIIRFIYTYAFTYSCLNHTSSQPKTKLTSASSQQKLSPKKYATEELLNRFA